MLPFGNFWEQNLEQNLFLVYFKTVDKTPSKNQILWISLSAEKKRKIRHISACHLTSARHCDVLNVTLKRHSCPNTAKIPSFSGVPNLSFKVSLLSEQPPITTPAESFSSPTGSIFGFPRTSCRSTLRIATETR